ncbi:MAG: OmpA family protein [Chitinivibrionales bacterium]|nr:OmpA family protein [Chitinivibrionales bacterium]MBD3356809.1 OmpA family protein [Chitinivibrionales bacterium]
MVKLMGKSAAFLFLLSLGASAAFNTNGQKGVVRTLSAIPSGSARMTLGIGTNFAVSSSYADDTTPGETGSSAKMFSSNILWNIGIGRQVDVALALPFYADWAGFKETAVFGLGDMAISTKILLSPYNENAVVFPSFLLGISAPTGQATSDHPGIFPRHPSYYPKEVNNSGYYTEAHFYTSKMPTIKPAFLTTFVVRGEGELVFRINTNLGVVIPTDKEMEKTALMGLGLELSPVSVVTLFTDLFLETRFSNLGSEASGDITRDPVMISPGIRVDAPVGVYMLLAADVAVGSMKDQHLNKWDLPDEQNAVDQAYTTAGWPRLGFHFQFGWSGYLTAQDQDKDGVKDDVDRCPKDPEDRDGFEDDDGCPDPDNDKDGIPDLEDQCPKLAEDFDGIDDKDGCPDPDNDNDAIPDSLDRCPNDPEDIDKYEDEDGCPDIDNDKDNIPDLRDQCPNEPESLNGIEDEDGCPDKKQAKKEPPMPKHQIVKGVNFKSGSIQMTFDSYQYLDPIIAVMKKYPKVEIEVRGHTDSVGGYEQNMRLSKLRAEAVRRHLMAQGIAGTRVRAVGFGPSSPIADNRSAAGRARNRRIEIVRIK